MLFFIYGFITAMVTGAVLAKGFSKGKFIAATCTSFLVGGILGWFFTPTLDGNFGTVWFYLCLGAVIALPFSNELNLKVTAITAVAVPLTWFILMYFIGSSKMIHYKSFKTLIGEQQVVDFDSTRMSPVDIKSLRIVDGGVARRLGEKTLGERAGLGSMVNLGTMNLQKLNGSFTIIELSGREIPLEFDNELYWVGPLEHSGLFKYMGNDSTPGYVMVSASDTSKVFLVSGLKSDDKTEKFTLNYSVEGSYFSKYLPRYLKSNGYLSTGLTDYSFEIDDSGRPYWVVTKYEKTIGVSGLDASGVVVVDAQTGEVFDYSVEEAPEWIDRIYPESFIINQLDDNGELVNGYWNFSKKDVTLTTPGYSVVLGADNRLYLYTGIQSAGADTSTTAFVLVDLRTKDVYRYNISGANEQAVKGVLENAPGAKEAGYKSSNPILYNVGGEPTYFAMLKGSDGISKMYGFVSLRNFEVYGVAESVSDALRRYNQKMRNKGVAVFDDLVEAETAQGTVIMTTSESIDGKLYYYYIIAGQEGLEFIVPTEMSIEAKWTKPGDMVSVEFSKGEGVKSINVDKFDNLGLNF